jgi:hypothetical protein
LAVNYQFTFSTHSISFYSTKDKQEQQKKRKEKNTMLAIRKAEKDTTTSLTVTANILPCKIQYNGPVNASRRHWAPEEKEEEANNNNNDKTDDVDMTNNTSTSTSTSTAYFRGRKLYGKTVHVPEGYRGKKEEERKKKKNALQTPPYLPTYLPTNLTITITIKEEGEKKKAGKHGNNTKQR